MHFSLLIQIVVSGLASGGVYGLIAIGYTVMYRLTGVIHFGFGSLVALAVFATLFVAAGTGPVSTTSIPPGAFILALCVGCVTCLVTAAGSYLFAIQPYLRRGSVIGWVCATVAISLAIEALLSSMFTQPTIIFPDPLPFHRLGHSGLMFVGGATVQIRSFFVIAVALVLAACGYVVTNHTRFGRGLRAIEADREGAAIVGVRVEPMIAAAFAFVGVLAFLAAVAAAPAAPFDVDSGMFLGLQGLVAALSVRFGSILAAFGAGLALGIIESGLAVQSVTGEVAQYSELIPLVLALLVLVWGAPRLRDVVA